jgi:hypothetical protein
MSQEERNKSCDLEYSFGQVRMPVFRIAAKKGVGALHVLIFPKTVVITYEKCKKIYQLGCASEVGNDLYCVFRIPVDGWQLSSA